MSSSATLLRWPTVLAVLLCWIPASRSLPTDNASLGEEGEIVRIVAPVVDDAFIIYRIHSSVPVVLVDDFGIMLINKGNEDENQKPHPRFIVACRSGRKLTDTEDPQIAALALAAIPEGSQIRWYDSCTMPRSFGLPDSVSNDLRAAIKRSKLTLLKEPNITCYCGLFSE